MRGGSNYRVAGVIWWGERAAIGVETWGPLGVLGGLLGWAGTFRGVRWAFVGVGKWIP